MPITVQPSVDWFAAVRGLLPVWPRDYLVLDTETSGLDARSDLPLQYGCVIVRDDKIVHSSRAYLNWVQSGHITEETLRSKMAGIAARMAERGAAYRLDCDTVLTEGHDPRVMVPALEGVLRDALQNGLALVGHNMAQYDLVMLSTVIKNMTGRSLLIPATQVWDTGMLEKARQMNSLPHHWENQVEWFMRIAGAKRRIKWKLDGHCADVYDLWTLSGLDPTAAHDALSDALLTHYLFRAIRDCIVG